MTLDRNRAVANWNLPVGVGIINLGQGKNFLFRLFYSEIDLVGEIKAWYR